METKPRKAAKRNPNPLPLYSRNERCRNPWNGRCENTDIALYIFYEGAKLPICGRCWHKIADKDFEWGERIGF